MMDIKTILVTTDFSDTSTQAFEPALTLADKFGARIILTHVEIQVDSFAIPEHMAMNLDLDSIRAHQLDLGHCHIRSCCWAGRSPPWREADAT